MTVGDYQSIRCPHCGKLAAMVMVMVAPDNGDDAEMISDEAREMLQKPIDFHPWPGRLRNVFQNESIKTFADLCTMTTAELFRIPTVGKRSVEEIELVLANYGLRPAPKKW